jgi:hypothetical protein
MDQFFLTGHLQLSYFILPLCDLSTNNRNSDMYNSTNTVEYFDWKDDNLYLRLRAMSHTIYAGKFEQTITHQHVHLRRESQSVTHVKLTTQHGFHELFLKF